MRKMRFLSLLAVAVLICGLVGCEADVDTGQIDIKQTVQETQQTTETMTERTEQVSEDIEKSETKTSAEKEDNLAETITIAGKEYSIDTTYVSIDIAEIVADEVTHTVDVSGLGKLKNLQGFSVCDRVDGGDYTVSGLNVLENSKTITSVDLQAVLYDKNDIHIFETMPNLKTFWLYGTYEDFEFNIPSLEELYLLGMYDLSKIEHLTELKDLSLVYNNSNDLSPIAKLKNLKGLKIEECKFEDYSSILELENLESLWISSYPMSEEMYNKICEKFPDCNITIINDFID